MNAGAEVTADAFNALTRGEQKLFRFGVLDSVTSQAMRKPREREALAIFSTPRVQELLGAAIPRTATKTGKARKGAEFADRPQRFGRFVDTERAMLDTRDVVRGNSMTARNLQDDLALAGMEAAQQVQGFVDMFRGSTSLWSFAQRFLEQQFQKFFGVGADAAAEAARMLFTANPQERIAIMQRIAQIMPADRMARFTELVRQIQRGIAPSAAFAGGMAGTPASGPAQI
jgi:hypothetical protein